MKKNKLYIDREMPSEEATNRHKNFGALLTAYEAQQTPQNAQPENPSSTKTRTNRRYYYLLGAIACLFLGFFLIYPALFQDKNAESNTSIAVNEQTIAPETALKNPVSEQITPETVQEPKKTAVAISPKTEMPKTEMPKTVQKEEEKTAAVMQTEQESQKQTATPAIIAPQRPKGKPIQLKLENESLHPELMTYKNHQWEYAGESDENNPWKNDVFGKGNHWDNASVKKTNQNQYEITLSRKDGATFSFPARIVFTGKAYDEALKTYETWKENQNK